MPERLLSDESFLLEAIKINPRIIITCFSPLYNNTDFIYKALKVRPDLYTYFRNLGENNDVDNIALNFLPNTLNEFFITAIKNNYQIINYLEFSILPHEI